MEFKNWMVVATILSLLIIVLDLNGYIALKIFKRMKLPKGEDYKVEREFFIHARHRLASLLIFRSCTVIFPLGILLWLAEFFYYNLELGLTLLLMLQSVTFLGLLAKNFYFESRKLAKFVDETHCHSQVVREIWATIATVFSIFIGMFLASRVPDIMTDESGLIIQMSVVSFVLVAGSLMFGLVLKLIVPKGLFKKSDVTLSKPTTETTVEHG